jgi:hypothetical protein
MFFFQADSFICSSLTFGFSLSYYMDKETCLKHHLCIPIYVKKYPLICFTSLKIIILEMRAKVVMKLVEARYETEIKWMW